MPVRLGYFLIVPCNLVHNVLHVFALKSIGVIVRIQVDDRNRLLVLIPFTDSESMQQDVIILGTLQHINLRLPIAFRQILLNMSRYQLDELFLVHYVSSVHLFL